MKITFYGRKDYLGRLGKGLNTSQFQKTFVRSKKNKKARCAITNINMEYHSKNIKEFENLYYKVYVRKGPNMNILTVNLI